MATGGTMMPQGWGHVLVSSITSSFSDLSVSLPFIYFITLSFLYFSLYFLFPASSKSRTPPDLQHILACVFIEVKKSKIQYTIMKLYVSLMGWKTPVKAELSAFPCENHHCHNSALQLTCRILHYVYRIHVQAQEVESETERDRGQSFD